MYSMLDISKIILATQKGIDDIKRDLDNRARRNLSMLFIKEEKVLITEIFEKPEGYNGKQFIILGEPLIILANGIPLWGKEYIAQTTKITKKEYEERFKK